MTVKEFLQSLVIAGVLVSPMLITFAGWYKPVRVVERPVNEVDYYRIRRATDVSMAIEFLEVKYELSLKDATDLYNLIKAIP